MDGSTIDLTSSERFESAIMSRAEPSRAEPSRAEPSRAEPSRAEPSRAEPSRAEPSRAEPSRAEPSRAEPSRAEPISPPRSRECCCPPPPDVLPPRQGGRPSLQSASAAGRPAFARLADARRALVRSARAVAAVAYLCLAGPLALPAQAQTTENFYLWRTTLTVGEDSGNLGYDKSDSFGSISTSADFGYPPWNPPSKHHVDRESYHTVEAIKSYQSSGTTFWVYPGFPIRLGALPGFVVGDRMWKALWKLVENEQRFPRRGGRVLCVHGAVSFHRARPCGRPVCRPGRHEGSLEPYRQNCDESGLQISPPGPLRRHDLPDRGFLHRF